MIWWQRINYFLTPSRTRYAWIGGGVLWIVWLLSILAGSGTMDSFGQVVGTDYVQFYAAGITVLRGESARLYDLGYQNVIENTVAGANFVGHHAFITPPFFAGLFVPFALVPYGWSFLVWSLLSLLAMWASVQWLGCKQPMQTSLWCLSWFPVFASISFGQNSLLSLAILSLSYLLWRRKQMLAAGLVCSLLMYKPQLALGVGFLWLLEWRRDWKALVGLAGGAAGLACLSFCLMPEASLAYLTLARAVLPRMITQDGFPIWHAHSVRAFFHSLLPGQVALCETLSLLVSAVGIILFVRLWVQHRNQPAIIFAAAICLTVLITPHAMVYDWSLLLIPAIVLWAEIADLRQLWKALFALVWVVTFISGQIAYSMHSYVPIAIQISVPTFILVLVTAYRALNASSAEAGSDAYLRR